MTAGDFKSPLKLIERIRRQVRLFEAHILGEPAEEPAGAPHHGRIDVERKRVPMGAALRGPVVSALAQTPRLD
jgi:hypothetical protein